MCDQDETNVYDFELKLRADLSKAAELLTTDQARYLVDLYYEMQHGRIVSANIARAMIQGDPKEPRELVEWFEQRQRRIEENLKNVLGRYAASKRSGRWAQSICGIGPVISAGLIAHIDPKIALYAGQVWRFAGLDPSVRWEKKTKRPWNAKLKVLCWKMGESFVKVQNNANDFYGKVYVKYKEREIRRNETGELAPQAAEKLERFKIGKDTEAYGHYSQGRLPPAHLHARAKRAAVKLFLSHYHAVAYECEHGQAPPRPYAIEHLVGHHHEIAVPNWPVD